MPSADTGLSFYRSRDEPRLAQAPNHDEDAHEEIRAQGVLSLNCPLCLGRVGEPTSAVVFQQNFVCNSYRQVWDY